MFFRPEADAYSLIHALLCFPHLFPSLLLFSWSHIKTLLLLFGKTDTHLTTIIREENERRCIDLIDSIIFSRSTWRRSEAILRRCMHTQEKHYRWHTHTHTLMSFSVREKRWVVHIAYTDRKVKNQSCLQDVCPVICTHLSYIFIRLYVCIIILKHASFPSYTTLQPRMCICPPIRVVYRRRNILPIDTLTEKMFLACQLGYIR
jgi:hypothetical protein